jgi:hypothetical protein
MNLLSNNLNLKKKAKEKKNLKRVLILKEC